ncbi:hypothetical protein [Paenibacillus sp. SN-8-1]|uniref:hypothetical protein n=1 Tax=Paenibacillus sp. SN-8-1 TaxID=3435409 RepID=UPI003D9A5761
MLTDEDVAWIRANRAEIKQHRTESVTTEHKDGSMREALAIWKEPPSPSGTYVRNVGDYSVDENDYNVTFDDTVDINSVVRIHRRGRRYVLTDVDERGLGGLNRYECRAMLAVTDGQSISVIKSGADDGWGIPAEAVSVPFPAFVTEETRTVRNQYGEEAVTQLRIILEGLAPISYRDKVRYVNELGNVVERTPQNIAVKRRVDGTPLVTEVFV